jgi:hypothetical protein
MRSTSTLIKLITGLGLLCVTLSLGCDDDSGGIEERSSAVLEVLPSAFVFPPAPPGSDAIDKTVTIKNVGRSELRLARITASFNDINNYLLDYRTFDPNEETADAGDFLVGLDAEGNNFPSNLVVPADQAVALRLRYTPSVNGASGEVTMLTNTETEELVIPIEGASAQADVLADPGAVDFGRVNVGDEKVMNLTLTNVGSAAAIIPQVFLNATDEFSIRLNGENAVGEPGQIPSLADPDGDNEPGLSPGESVVFEVVYRPTSEISQPGNVVFALQNSL